MRYITLQNYKKSAGDRLAVTQKVAEAVSQGLADSQKSPAAQAIETEDVGRRYGQTSMAQSGCEGCGATDAAEQAAKEVVIATLAPKPALPASREVDSQTVSRIAVASASRTAVAGYYPVGTTVSAIAVKRTEALPTTETAKVAKGPADFVNGGTDMARLLPAACRLNGLSSNSRRPP